MCTGVLSLVVTRSIDWRKLVARARERERERDLVRLVLFCLVVEIRVLLNFRYTGIYTMVRVVIEM
ncbi:hypothetical protein Scep_029230 [Stephania cephalantha]|uniref:Uncharacterized protein n=1 Tax=Stephania cephalantha TaxID=152367 RepID=A0AAP0DX80_9MAGN